MVPPSCLAVYSRFCSLSVFLLVFNVSPSCFSVLVFYVYICWRDSSHLAEAKALFLLDLPIISDRTIQPQKWTELTLVSCAFTSKEVDWHEQIGEHYWRTMIAEEIAEVKGSKKVWLIHHFQPLSPHLLRSEN